MIGLLAAPLLLLLTLRANASLGRLLEARLLWGGLVLHARSLASLLRIKFFPEFPEAATLTVRYLSMYGWIVKAYVRGESKESEKEVLRTMLGDDTQDVQWLESQKKRTVAVTSRIRQLCGSMLDRLQDRSTASALQYIIDDKIAALETVVGGCERLFTSPIPPTYSRHLSRVLTIWILLMPMSFIAMGLSTAAVSASSAVASYVLIGIDEVGMEIENVFTLLPLQQLAGAVQNDVRDQFVPDMPEVPFPL
jgi:predicted membrane chloride channel (bestrophin family)